LSRADWLPLDRKSDNRSSLMAWSSVKGALLYLAELTPTTVTSDGNYAGIRSATQ